MLDENGNAVLGRFKFSNIQLNKGESIREYTPYAEPAATINDGVNSYSLSAGEYADVLTLKTDENTLNVSGEGIIYIDYTEESY